MRSQMIEDLIKYKSKLLNSIEKSEQKSNSLLKKFNNGICFINGHDYTDWIYHKSIDTISYYTRECKICGRKQKSYNTPKEVNVSQLILRRNERKGQ